MKGIQRTIFGAVLILSFAAITACGSAKDCDCPAFSSIENPDVK